MIRSRGTPPLRKALLGGLALSSLALGCGGPPAVGEAQDGGLSTSNGAASSGGDDLSRSSPNGGTGGAQATGGESSDRGGAAQGASAGNGGTAQGSTGGATSSPSAGTGGQGGQDGQGGQGGQGGQADPESGVPDTDGLCEISLRCDEEIVDEPKVLCELEIVGAVDGPRYASHAGVEVRGRSSQKFPKKNYAIELRLATGEENPTNLLGMGRESDWVLDGSWADRSLMRNAMVFDLFREMGGANYASEGRYCTLTLGGEPQGIYRLVEKVKKDDDRVGLTDDDGTASSFIIKQDGDGVLRSSAIHDEAWQVIYPKQDRATQQQLDGVQAWLDGFSAALHGGDPGNPDTGVFAYLDLDVAIDWVLLQELSKNIDGYNLSVHLARDAGGRARLIPWDFDLSFGQPTVAEAQNAEGSPPPNPVPNESPEGWTRNRTSLIRAMSAVAEFRSRLSERWGSLRGSLLGDEAILARVDAFQARVEPAVADNFEVWPIEEVEFTSIYGPYSFYDVTSYAEEMSALRAWLTARLAWIDANIAAYPGG